MTTFKLLVLKTHMAAGQWAHAGDTVHVEESRANELVHTGLAKRTDSSPSAPRAPVASGLKAARTVSNKKMPEPDNKTASDVLAAVESAAPIFASVRATVEGSATPAHDASAIDGQKSEPFAPGAALEKITEGE